MNALEYMMKEYKDIPLEKMRSVVGAVLGPVLFCRKGLLSQHHSESAIAGSCTKPCRRGCFEESNMLIIECKTQLPAA